MYTMPASITNDQKGRKNWSSPGLQGGVDSADLQTQGLHTKTIQLEVHKNKGDAACS